MQHYLEEVKKECSMKEMEHNQQNDAHMNFVGKQKALKIGEFPSLCDQGCVYENFQNFKIGICVSFSLVVI